MNAREQFVATMHYQPRDRCPIMDFGFWRETLVIWEQYGFPKGGNPDSFFGMDPQWAAIPVSGFPCPDFGYTVLEDRGDTEVVRGADGVTVEQGKFLGSIPRHVDHTLKDRASWEKEFKWRLNGKNPDRYPRDWPEQLKKLTDPDRDYPLHLSGGSLYGWIRNWMGMETVSMLVHDDRPLFEEMVETIADCIIETNKPAMEAGIRPECVNHWEDMCYRGGPLLSPRIFREVLVPHYKRITSFFRRYGVDVALVDCDGDISQLAPLWLEAGINTMFPIEVGTWGHDPVQFRKQYGRDMLLIGGVSKTVLAGPLDGITREVERLAPLVEEGGFIPTPDHRVPPDVPLKNYIFYLTEAKRIWGKGLSNLKPTGRIDPNAPKADATRYSWHLGD
ncbi:MAG: hypothetical protein HY360_02015 [Verrucomicrobia bacterium]|nr:hypothetical protein [Verrucomicrobiota bacterium]